MTGWSFSMELDIKYINNKITQTSNFKLTLKQCSMLCSAFESYPEMLTILVFYIDKIKLKCI